MADLCPFLLCLGICMAPQAGIAPGEVHIAVGAPVRMYHIPCVPESLKGPGPLIRGRSVPEPSYRYAQQMLQVL